MDSWYKKEHKNKKFHSLLVEDESDGVGERMVLLHMENIHALESVMDPYSMAPFLQEVK